MIVEILRQHSRTLHSLVKVGEAPGLHSTAQCEEDLLDLLSAEKGNEWATEKGNEWATG